MIRLLSRTVTHEVLRYGTVGIVSNLAGYFTYLIITYFGTEPKFAMSIVYLIGASISFYGNKTHTFSHSGKILGTGIRYLIAHCCGYIINLIILIIFIDKLSYPHQLVQAVAVLVVAIFLFIVFKYFVFFKQD